MTEMSPRQWTPFAVHPLKADTLRVFRLAPIVVLAGPSMWSFLILAASFGLTDVFSMIAAGFIILQMAFIVRAKWEVTTQRISIDVFRNRFGLNSMRTLWISFCFLGWALAYGSDGFYWCVGSTVIAVIIVEIRAIVLARRITNKSAEELVGSCIKTTTEGTFYLKAAVPSLAGTDLGKESLWIEKFGMWVIGGAPLLSGLAFGGTGDSVAGFILTAFGLFFYSASMGNWVASHLLRRVISDIEHKGGKGLDKTS
ncbi:hypothetical protein KUV57_13255 [Epibacterium sp. DP7N7-1]|nr:hypothetical protein [Epibacterium sp. DP7N7-1]